MKKMQKCRILVLIIALMCVFTVSSLSEDTVWNCPECGQENSAENRYCTNCATPRPEQKRSWDCPECGRTGNTGNFCGYCGTAKPDDNTTKSAERESADMASAFAGKEETAVPEVKPNEYFANGKIKKEYIYNTEGFISRTNYYNRYGFVTSYAIPEKWDQNGNVLQDTKYYPFETGKYSKYQNYYTYDERGNEVSYFYTYADGSNGYTTLSQYDGNDHVVSRTQKDPEGKVTGTSGQYQYENDKITGYTSYDVNGQVEETVRSVYQNGVLVESISYDSSGRIIGKYTYDPIYGDSLTSEYESDGDKYEEIITYSEAYYETDWRSLSSGYRYITRYTPEGKKIKRESYKRSMPAGEWTYESTTEYSTNSSGNAVEQTNYADGRKYYVEKDQNGNSILSRSTGADGSEYYTESDRNGNTILSRSTNADGTFNYAYSHEYDSNGKEVRLNRLKENGEIENYTLYEYNSEGLESKSMCYYADGSFFYGNSSEYNSAGQKIRQNNLEADGSIKSYELTEYNSDGSMKQSVTYNADGSISSEYKYDKDGLSYAAYYYSGVLSSEYFYRTAADGTREEKTIRYNSDGSIREYNGWPGEETPTAKPTAKPTARPTTRPTAAPTVKASTLSPNNKCPVQPTIYVKPRYYDTKTQKANNMSKGLSAKQINNAPADRQYGLYFKFTPARSTSAYYISRFDLVISDTNGQRLYEDGFNTVTLCRGGYYWSLDFLPLEGLYREMRSRYGEVVPGRFVMDIYFNGLWAGKTNIVINK